MQGTRSQARISKQKAQNASHSHLITPQKARILQAYEDHKEAYPHGPPSSNQTLIQKIKNIGASKTTFYRTIRSKLPGDDDRTIHNRADVTEPRGRPLAISPTQIERMERILMDADVETRSMTWEVLGHEAGLNHVSIFTIRRIMDLLDYFKCVAY